MQTELIYEVTKVDVEILAYELPRPPRIKVTATGNANSGSHLNARLIRRVYEIFPADGIQEYDFLIDVPEGPATDDMKSHTDSDYWYEFPPQLNVVKVYAKNNNIVEKDFDIRYM